MLSSPSSSSSSANCASSSVGLLTTVITALGSPDTPIILPFPSFSSPEYLSPSCVADISASINSLLFHNSPGVYSLLQSHLVPVILDMLVFTTVQYVSLILNPTSLPTNNNISTIQSDVVRLQKSIFGCLVICTQTRRHTDQVVQLGVIPLIIKLLDIHVGLVKRSNIKSRPREHSHEKEKDRRKVGGQEKGRKVLAEMKKGGSMDVLKREKKGLEKNMGDLEEMGKSIHELEEEKEKTDNTILNCTPKSASVLNPSTEGDFQMCGVTSQMVDGVFDMSLSKGIRGRGFDREVLIKAAKVLGNITLEGCRRAKYVLMFFFCFIFTCLFLFIYLLCSLIEPTSLTCTATSSLNATV
jgi:hypothetical protein